MSKYIYLDKKLRRIVKEAERIVRESDKNFKSCTPKCISCLVASARSNDDTRQYEFGFNSRDDLAMIDAKYVLLKKKKFKDWLDN